MSTRGTRANDYPSGQFGPTASQPTQHFVDSRAQQGGLGHNGTGHQTGMDYSGGADQGGFSGHVEPAVAQRGAYGGETGTQQRAYDSGQHTGTRHGKHTVADTHVPGSDLAQGNQQYSDTSGVTSHGHNAKHTGIHTGTHHGEHTGTYADTGTAQHSSASGGTTGGTTQHKATIGEKIKGNVEELGGRMTNDPERIEAGQQLKFGTHPSQSGNMYGGGRQDGA